MRMTDRWKHTCEQWGILSYYQRFESGVALVLTFIVGAIIVIALYRLTLSVVVGLIFAKADPLQPEVFQYWLISKRGIEPPELPPQGRTS